MPIQLAEIEVKGFIVFLHTILFILSPPVISTAGRDLAPPPAKSFHGVST